MTASKLRPICLGVLAVASLFAAASCSKDDCAATSTCPVQSMQDASTELLPPFGCTPNADAKDNPACMAESYALCVDAKNGNDGNPGTKALPFKTVEAATKYLAGRPRIYACVDGKIEERIVLPANVSLIGGFVCGSWVNAGSKHTLIQPLSLVSLPALTVSPSTKPLEFSDLDIVANDAVSDGGSSVGVLVTSAAVTFRRVIVKAGGGRSAGAVAATPTNAVPTNVIDGQPANGSVGGAGGDCTCFLIGRSSGGKGGDISTVGGAGSAQPTPPSMPGIDDGAGGLGGASCANGTRGAHGAAGKIAEASKVLGALTMDGWIPGAGADGAVGNPGGGGGGGGGAALGGGGGACGGCGGAGGPGGKGGGGSIALALAQADVTLVTSTLTTSVAGNAQDGSDGEEGFGGGKGGSASCSGATGGNGAGGNGGAGGAGGVSSPIVRRGGSLNIDIQTKLVPGSVGSPGNPGVGKLGGLNANGRGASGLDGEPGLAPTNLSVLVL